MESPHETSAVQKRSQKTQVLRECPARACLSRKKIGYTTTTWIITSLITIKRKEDFFLFGRSEYL